MMTSVKISKASEQDDTSTNPPPAPNPAPIPNKKPPLTSLISPHDFHLAALSSFPPKTLAFVTSAATDSHTHRRNSTYYSHLHLRPRVLINVSAPVSLSTTILGQPVSSPIFAAPTSLGKTVHPLGEVEIAAACSFLDIAQVISTSASFSLSEILENPTDHAVFFQLYMDRHRPNSSALLRLIGQTPRIKGVWLTVDAPVMGKREADERVAIDSSTEQETLSPMSGTRHAKSDAKGGALGRIMGAYVDPSVSWDEGISFMRRHLPKGAPVVLKGIQTAADAIRAMEAGVEGIVISNHGGRSLDTSTPTILVLLELQRCCPEVFDRMEVFIDGGITRGTDVFKALCLGARAVGIGRGVLYGLNYGREGVKRYVEILQEELVTTMKMCGVRSLEECHPGLVNTREVDHLVPLPEEGRGGGHPWAKWRRGGSKL
ncbi:FMN-dependent dehydrogenase [Podospora australis]|uniref:FMN-dependent dehydrogenase n=1 Tax=Podospora australis TaxID=1536484 RepID=A0AAN6X2V5_9PEZI|nr:FMN-dependent dehydrogenase [Podospora australis]